MTEFVSAVTLYYVVYKSIYTLYTKITVLPKLIRPIVFRKNWVFIASSVFVPAGKLYKFHDFSLNQYIVYNMRN